MVKIATSSKPFSQTDEHLSRTAHLESLKATESELNERLAKAKAERAAIVEERRLLCQRGRPATGVQDTAIRLVEGEIERVKAEQAIEERLLESLTARYRDTMQRVRMFEALLGEYVKAAKAELRPLRDVSKIAKRLRAAMQKVGNATTRELGPDGVALRYFSALVSDPCPEPGKALDKFEAALTALIEEVEAEAEFTDARRTISRCAKIHGETELAAVDPEHQQRFDAFMAKARKDFLSGEHGSAPLAELRDRKHRMDEAEETCGIEGGEYLDARVAFDAARAALDKAILSYGLSEWSKQETKTVKSNEGDKE